MIIAKLVRVATLLEYHLDALSWLAFDPYFDTASLCSR